MANYNIALRLGGTSKRWRDRDARMSVSDSDYHQDHEEPPPSFCRNANDETDIKHLRMMYTHPILLPVLKQFQIQEAYNNNSDYDNSESEETTTRLVSDVITHFLVP